MTPVSSEDEKVRTSLKKFAMLPSKKSVATVDLAREAGLFDEERRTVGGNGLRISCLVDQGSLAADGAHCTATINCGFGGPATEGNEHLFCGSVQFGAEGSQVLLLHSSVEVVGSHTGKRFVTRVTYQGLAKTSRRATSGTVRR
jgi:hypothetical protein